MEKLQPSSLAIPKGDTILITGSTGSVGGAVAREIVKAGYKIRALVRNEGKGKYLQEALEASFGSGLVELAHFDSLADTKAIESAIQDCSGVVHVASDISASDNPEEVINPVVDAVKVLLEAASKTPSVKRFVFTSSLATLPSAKEAADITPSSWASDSIIESAWAAEDPDAPRTKMQKGLAVYGASKILAERACWDYVKEKKPHFVVNTVVAFTNIGAFVHPKLVSSFNGLVLGVWLGDLKATEFFKSVMIAAGVHHLINLEDCGLLHLAALALDEVRSERILAAGDAFTFNDTVEVMQKLEPGRSLPERLADDAEAEVKASIDRTRTKELLGKMGKPGLTGLEESIKQLITSGTGVSL